jgi:hypothetical protein
VEGPSDVETGLGGVKSLSASLSVGVGGVVVVVGVVADTTVGLGGVRTEAAMAASKGLTSWCKRPDLGSGLGVVWSCGHNFKALDLRKLWTEPNLSRQHVG